MSLKSSSITIASLLLCLALPGQAAVTNAEDVGGLRTFQDSNTGRIWLDIDNFFNADASVGMTGYEMVAAAQTLGFAVANTADIHQLLDSLPGLTTNWLNYTSVIGSAPHRNLIWGIYDNANTAAAFDWAFAYQGDPEWSFSGGDDGFTIAAGNPVGNIDLGIWAYRPATSIPEPATYAMLLVGLGLVGFAARRRAQIAS